MGRLEENRKMTEYEIQKLRDMALSLDPEEAYIVYSALAQKKVDQADAIRATICDKYCKSRAGLDWLGNKLRIHIYDEED